MRIYWCKQVKSLAATEKQKVAWNEKTALILHDVASNWGQNEN